jgi:4-amino-4-deoxy-L-arabinose transferase-like glycosyltransferase
MDMTSLFTEDRQKKLLIPLLILVAVTGTLLLLYATPRGVGLGFDSVAYISAARNFLHGIGLGRMTCLGFKPMTFWPPFYPLVLAFFNLFGLDALVAARLVSALGFGMTVFLAGFLVSRITKNLVFPLLASFLIILFSPILRIFSWAMSEALFVPLALGALLFFGEYLEHPRQKYLILGGVLVGLAILTRFIAIALLAIGILILILDTKSTVGQRIKNILIFVVIACFPIIVWMTRNEIVAHTSTGRKIGLNIPPMIKFDPFIQQITSWVLPVSYTVHRMRLLLIGIFFIALVVSTLIIIVKRKKSLDQLKILLLFLLYVIIYPLVILTTIVFFTPSMSVVDERILVPLLVGLLILFALFVVYAWNTKKWYFRFLCILIFLWMIAYHLPQQVENIKTLHSDGQGYAAKQWQESPAVEYLQELPTEMIYTNDFQATYFMAGLNACILPTGEQALKEMQENIRNGNGSVIIIGSHIPEFLPLEVMVEGMNLVKEFPNVRIFQYPNLAP